MIFLRIVIIDYNDEIEFYEHCDFKKVDDASPKIIPDYGIKISNSFKNLL